MKEKSYKEELPHGQGKDLEPKDHWEIKSNKADKPKRERDDDRRADGTNLDHYTKDQRGLGSPSLSDDYGENSFP